jgi:hypothetical protein
VNGHAGEFARLTVLAEGPYTTGNDGLLTTTLRVPVERVGAGPRSARFDVIVRGPGRRPFSVDLNDPEPPWMVVDHAPATGLADLLHDSRFLAQQVYAVAASTLALFESTLGRRMGWFGNGRLKLFVYDSVSYAATGYDRHSCAIRFGHRRDGRAGSAVPLALYRDLVVHEVTHAILDGYRRRWADESATMDQFALHEALADLVALLSVFSSEERVEQLLTATPTDVEPGDVNGRLLRSGLFKFTDGLFTHGAVRSPLEGDVPDGWREISSPHRRGQVVVRAVLDVVVRLWTERLEKPGGRSSLYQVAQAGASVGLQVLRMLIRGLGYMPPVDATWEDLLRGILAADQVLVPDDPMDYRGAMRQAFAGIGVETVPDDQLDGLGTVADLRYPVRLAALGSDPEEVTRFLWENPVLLEAARIDPARPIIVERVRPSVRISPDGFVVSEIGASFVQEFVMSASEARRFGLRTQGPVMVRGGGLIRFDEGGRLCYAALKPVLDLGRQQQKLGVVLREQRAAAETGVKPRSTEPAARAAVHARPEPSVTFHPHGR